MTDLAQPIIDFMKVIESDFVSITNEEMELPNMPQDKRVSEILDHFIDDFDKVGIDDIFSYKSEHISDFLDLIQQNVSIKACNSLSMFWPPILPTYLPHLKYILGIMIQSVRMTDDPEKMLRFFSAGLFPKLWNPQNALSNKVLSAFGKCKGDKFSLENVWATLDSKKVLRIYQIEDCQVLFDCVVHSFDVKPNGIVIQDKNHKEAFFLSFNEIEMTNYWKNVLDGALVPFPLFFSQPIESFPEIILTSFFESCTTNDMTLARCIAQFKNERMIEFLYNILSYAGKSSLFFTNIFSVIFEDQNIEIKDLLSKDSLFSKVISIVFKKFGKDYITSFVTKLLQYIDSKYYISIRPDNENHMAEIEQFFFSVVKYIVNSADIIPPQIRFVANIIRTYLPIRFNKKQYLVQMLQYFFFDSFLLKLLQNPEQNKLIPKMNHPKQLQTLVPLLVDAFHLDSENHNPFFEKWSERIQYHTKNSILEFYYSIGDINSTPEFSQISKPELITSLQTLYGFVSNNHREFITNLKNYINESVPQGGSLGWNLTSLVTSIFTHCYDQECLISFRKDLQEEHLRMARKDKPSAKQQDNPFADAPTSLRNITLEEFPKNSFSYQPSESLWFNDIPNDNNAVIIPTNQAPVSPPLQIPEPRQLSMPPLPGLEFGRRVSSPGIVFIEAPEDLEIIPSQKPQKTAQSKAGFTATVSTKRKNTLPKSSINKDHPPVSTRNKK